MIINQLTPKPPPLTSKIVYRVKILSLTHRSQWVIKLLLVALFISAWFLDCFVVIYCCVFQFHTDDNVMLFLRSISRSHLILVLRQRKKSSCCAAFCPGPSLSQETLLSRKERTFSTGITSYFINPVTQCLRYKLGKGHCRN